MITAYEGKLFSIDPQFTSKEQLEEEDNELLEDLEDEFESKKNDPLADSDLTKGSGVQKKGHWLPADTEKILTFLASFAKSYTSKDSLDVFESIGSYSINALIDEIVNSKQQLQYPPASVPIWAVVNGN